MYCDVCNAMTKFEKCPDCDGRGHVNSKIVREAIMCRARATAVARGGWRVCPNANGP